MTRTQIQLPDEVYARAKRLCQAREISLAELARRGIEHILSVYSSAVAAAQARMNGSILSGSAVSFVPRPVLRQAPA